METPAMPPQQVQPPSGLPPHPQIQVNQDTEHLKILSICYYVMSGLSLISAAVFMIYVVMGGAMMSGKMTGGGATSSHAASEMRMMGGFFLVIGILGTLFVVAIAVLEFFVAKKLVRRESKMLCFVVAGLNCLSMPLGTVLGIFTFLVLSRPSVAESFARNQDH